MFVILNTQILKKKNNKPETERRVTASMGSLLSTCTLVGYAHF